MSIPKEPRQLMINLMYLVLTALLALNVSAEVFNAFEQVDRSLGESNNALDANNTRIEKQIPDLAKKKPEYAVYADRVSQVRETSANFVNAVQTVVDDLIDKTGNNNGAADEGDYREEYGKSVLKGKKNKDITTRILVGEPKDDTDSDGDKLAILIRETSDEFLQFIDEADRATFTDKISLKVDEAWKNSKKKNWAHFNFYQMPLAATLPIFTKLQNDAKSTEAAILNYYMEKVGGEDLVLDKFQVVSAARKTYIIQGEKFETDVFLSASASESSGTGIKISVNGSPLSVNDEGVASYSQTASGLGVKKYTAKIEVTNPVTNEVTEHTGEFEYEVGLRSVSVSADKMNVFYIGVNNPISVAAGGVPSQSLKVSGSGGGMRIKSAGKNKYTVTVNKPDDNAAITVSGEGLRATKFPFRVKRIPDPVARLGKNSGGSMGNGEFKAQGGVGAFLDNFDFEATCQVAGFTLVYVAKRQDPVQEVNSGPRYNSSAKRLVNKAKPGDIYYFDNVRAKCPGDEVTRKINSMVFNIK